MSAASSAESAAKFNPEDINISVDLVPAARNLLEFLTEISAKHEYFEGPFVECAIQRYEKFWLPLVAKHPGRLLPAPLDIEWIWQCHLLAPEKYYQDCEKIAGRIIDHHLIDKTMRIELIKDSERLWKAEYADVPFSVSATAPSVFDANFVSSLCYNIKSAVSRQKTFFYQVSLPHYHDEKFLKNALIRYKKFLYLKHRNPSVFLVPCYDNDLIWHSHMMFPVYYKDDTQNYLGAILSHDDSVNDRSKGSKLCVSEAKTRMLWKKVFNEKSSYFGAMFRGQPPYSKLHAMTRDDVYRVATKQVSVLIEKVRITGLPQGKAFKLKLCYNTGYQNFNRSLYVTENIATVKGNSRTLEDYKINTNFSFDTRYNDKIIASIQKKSGRLCLGTSDMLGEGKLDLQRKVQPLKTRGLTANDDIDCGDGMSVGMVWSCPTPELGPCVFRLEPGDYQGCIMPPDRESLWGPIPLPRLPPGSESTCSVASHKLYNHMRKPVFTVRMIHSEPMLMSAIQVFNGDKMTAVAHLVVGDHLPLPSSVKEPKKCVTLNPKEGQRAVLIKNHRGDWGVAVGWWEGIHPRGSGRKGSCSEGHLEVRFFHLPTHRWLYVSFDRLYSLATSKFEIGDCKVEFDSGFIAIDSQRCEISENIALIFSVTLIHVLCQPRPTSWNPGLSSPAPSQTEGSSVPPSLRLGGSEDITLLIAAGILIATPSNHAIRNLFKRKKQTFRGAPAYKRLNVPRQDDENENDNEQTVIGSELNNSEPNGGPPMILHEAEVNPGADKRKQILKVAAATRLMSITEQHSDEVTEDEEQHDERGREEGEEEEEEENRRKLAAGVAAIAAGTALLSQGEEEEQEVGKQGAFALNDQAAGFGGGDAEGRKEEEEEEGVFSVEGYGSEGDGQACMFGDGESDSDEVQADDDDDGGNAAFQGGILVDDEEQGGDEVDNDEEEEEAEEEDDAAGSGGEEGEGDVEEAEQTEEAKEEEEKEDEYVEEDPVDPFGHSGYDDDDDGGRDVEDGSGMYNGMVNGFEDDDYMDDAEDFYNEFYNMDGDGGNQDSAWGEEPGGGGNEPENDDVFLPSEQYNGYGNDHNSSHAENNHHDTGFDFEHQQHNSQALSFGSGSDAYSGKGTEGSQYVMRDLNNYDRDHDHDQHGNPPNYSYECMNGEVPESLDPGGDSGACGGCGG